MSKPQFLNSLSLKTGGLVAVSVMSAYITIKKIKSMKDQRNLENDRQNRLIVITGCDTGLGYSMAVWAAKVGYKVLAGCLNENGEGAQKLRKQFPEHVIVTGLNVTDAASLENFLIVCKQTLEMHEGKLRLWALIVNAAVCTLGEFLWQTGRQKEHQLNVNFWGAINFISGFRGLLLDSKARVIVVSSDCAEYPLPFLSVYCASKAALDSWSQSFRLEVAKYGVHVVAFHPRDFSMSSGLFGNLEQHYQQMKAEMNAEEQKFYGDYFDKFMQAKQDVFVGAKKKAVKPLGNHLKKAFLNVLENNVQNISVYRDSDVLSKVFHTLCYLLPQRYSDKLINVLLNPDFNTINWQENKLGA